VVIGDKAYDSEVNHILVRDILHAVSVIPARYEHVPIRNTHGKYRKLMKCGYSKLLYSQRNKDETIVSVIKRLFGEHITSRLVKTQNRELSFRCIAYNIHRLTNIVVISVVSTKPSLAESSPTSCKDRLDGIKIIEDLELAFLLTETVGMVNGK
jgi:hypothetical protein